MLLNQGSTISDTAGRIQIYGTVLDFLVLGAFLGVISAIRYAIVRSRRRAHKQENVPVA